MSESTIVNALKRLERAGSEHSRATEKLCEAARVLGGSVAARLPQSAFVADYPTLPRGYAWDYAFEGGLVLCQWDHGRQAYYAVDFDRAKSQAFAADIAAGWLSELAAWLEVRATEDAAATAVLEAAKVVDDVDEEAEAEEAEAEAVRIAVSAERRARWQHY